MCLYNTLQCNIHCALRLRNLEKCVRLAFTNCLHQGIYQYLKFKALYICLCSVFRKTWSSHSIYVYHAFLLIIHTFLLEHIFLQQYVDNNFFHFSDEFSYISSCANKISSHLLAKSKRIIYFG